MKDIDTLLRSLLEKRVIVWAVNGELRYKGPRGALRPDELAQLHAQKLASIASLKQHVSTADLPLQARSLLEVVPLTYQQQWLWNRRQRIGDWHHQTNMALAIRLRGPLNVEWMQASVDDLSNRHEALRTRITIRDGVPIQHIEEPATHVLRCTRVTAEAAEGPESAAARLAVKFCEAPLDATAGPLFEAQLFELGDADHVLVLVMDHLISDGYSMGIAIREICTNYAARARGDPPSQPIPLQYADYAVWQQRSRAIWKRQHDSYWTERLAGATRMRLPPDAGITGVAPLTARVSKMKISGTFSDGMRRLAIRERTTLARSILAVYATAVFLASNMRDFVIPCTVIGRQPPATLQVVGYFTHLLYLRCQLAEEDTFLDILRRIDDEWNAADAHDDHGQMAVMMPHFESGTRFHWNPWTNEAAGYRTGVPDAPQQTSPIVRMEPFALPKFVRADGRTYLDIVVEFRDSAAGISSEIGYRADLFTARTIEQFSRGMGSIIAKAVEDPGFPVRRLENTFHKEALL